MLLLKMRKLGCWSSFCFRKSSSYFWKNGRATKSVSKWLSCHLWFTIGYRLDKAITLSIIGDRERGVWI